METEIEKAIICEKVTFTSICYSKARVYEIACGFIRQWVDDNVLNYICYESDARTMWDKLRSLIASKIGNNKFILPKQAMNLRYKEGYSISDHLSEFQGCFDQLFDMGVKFEDHILVFQLLNTLLDSWKKFLVSLISSASSGVVMMMLKLLS